MNHLINLRGLISKTSIINNVKTTTTTTTTTTTIINSSIISNNKYYTTINNKNKYPTTMLKLKKKVSIDLSMNKYKIDEIEKKLELLLIKEEEEKEKKEKEKEEIKKKKDQNQNQNNNLLIGFGLNNLKNDLFIEKENEKIKNEIENEKIEKRKLKLQAMKQEYSNQLKSKINNTQREKIYNKLKLIQESKNKTRLINKKWKLSAAAAATTTTEGTTSQLVFPNKFEPFEKINLNKIKELNELIEKFKINQSIDEITFQQRLNLHLHSFQIHLKNNLFKSQFPMIFNNLNRFYLKEQDKRTIEKLVDDENFYDVIAMARVYHQEQFKQGNLVYHYAFEYLKKNKKLWRFFQLLENPDFNFQLDPLDFSEMVHVFLELDQIHSAEMLTSNMQNFLQDFYPDVFIHFFEYFNRQPDATISSITSEFISTFKHFSFNEKEYLSFQKPRIKEKKELFLKEKQQQQQQQQQSQQSNQKDIKDDNNEHEEEDEEKKDDQLNNLPIDESEFIDKMVEEDELSRIPVRNIEMYKSILVYCYKNGYIEFAENLEDFMEKEGVLLDLEMFNSKLKYQALEGNYITEESLNAENYYITTYNNENDKKSTTNNKESKKKNKSKTAAAAAEALLENKNQFIGNSQTFQAILYHSLIINQDVETSLASLASLKKKWSFKLNTFIINQLIFGLARLNQIETAIKYYKMLPSSTNGIYSKIMNQSIILYSMSYYNYSSNDLISFIKDNGLFDSNNNKKLIDKPTLDLIIYGYLLDNNYKLEQFIKNQKQEEEDNNNNTTTTTAASLKINKFVNMVDNLIQVLNYLKNENLISNLDKESIDFIFSRLLILKNQYNIKPSSIEFKLFKQLIK